MRHANGIAPTAVGNSRHASGSGSTYYYSAAPPQLHTSTRSLNHPPSAHSVQSPQPIHHTSSAASSPAQPTTQTYRTVTTTKLDPPHRAGTLPSSRRAPSSSLPPADMDPPTFYVEHLASFAVGRQFGLQTPADGIRKLKQMERNSAIWAQPLLLKLFPDRISVEEENGELVEQFAMDLVVEPTAHQSNDPQEVFNNVLLFVVKEDQRNGRRSLIPTEMHIFQCFHVSANDVADDIHQYTRRNFHKVRPGRRGSNQPHPSAIPPPAPNPGYYSNGGLPGRRGDYKDDASVHNGNDFFEYDVNTLNRCFDDIERFVARIQSAALAQRELEIQQHRLRSQKSKNKAHDAALHAQQGILQMRAQIPSYNEFFDIFQKFKLCFNLLAKLKNHIHDPNAPELLHFLFTPLSVIFDACHWGLGKNVAEQVLSPLLTFEACELLRNCLTSKEIDTWMLLGKAWRTPAEDWPGPLPPPYRPTFYSNFAGAQHNNGGPYPPPPAAGPYDGLPPSAGRYPNGPGAIHRGASAPPPQQNYAPPPSARSGGPPYRERSFDNLDFEKSNFEREKLEFEKRKVREREARLHEDERRLRQEQARLEAERRLLHREAEKQSMAGSDRPDFYRRDDFSSAHPSPRTERRMGSTQALNGHSTAPPPQQQHSGGSGFASPRPQPVPAAAPHANGVHQTPSPAQPVSAPIPLSEQSPRQQAFVDELLQKGAKAVQVTYDRVAQNPKELTVSRGEFLEVLNDNRNWWECKNSQTRVGYVPHTILSVVTANDHSPRSNQDSYSQERPAPPGPPNQSHSPRAENHYAMPSEPATVKSEQSLIDGLQSVKLRPVHQLHLDPDYMEVDDVYGTKPSKKLSKLIMDEQKYVPEMVDTIKQKRQLIGTRRVTSIRGPPITMDSSVAQVQQWLTLKGFSDYVKSVLSKCNGEHLFRITRKQLQQYCGEEANRLYSLITVQKKRANYSTGTEKQLKALLEMRKRHVDEHNDADSEPGDQLSLAEQRPPSVVESIGGGQPKGKVVPLDPQILMSQPIVIAPVKRPLQQTNNLPAPATNGVHKPVVLPTKQQSTSNYIAPKKGSIPDQVQIQILPRARIPAAPLPATIQHVQPTQIAVQPIRPATEIRPVEVKTAPEYLPPKQPQHVQPTIVQVNPPADNDEDSDDMNDSPRTQSLRQIAQTVKRYY